MDENIVLLEEIRRELRRPGAIETVPAESVRRWMKTDDTDTLGAVYAFLSNAAEVRRVSPPLQFDEVFDFLLRYYEFCFRNNPTSDWADSRYSAGSDLTGWFVQMWDEKQDRKYFDAIKSLLERLYLSGTAELKKCIEHSVVEHLFERKPIRKLFEDWSRNPELRPAYDEGMLWVDHGGASPLTEPRKPNG